MYKFACKHCKKEIEVEKSGQVGAHITHCVSNPNRGKSYEKIKIIGPSTSIKNGENLKEVYYNNSKKCINCNCIIDYEKIGRAHV